MLKQIKRLAGQTAIYGIPSIVGRVLNYLLVPLYTRVLDQAEYGTLTLMYSFVAVVFIILTYGMETAFFRYNELKGNKPEVYNTAQISLLFTTLVFFILAILFSGRIAFAIRYPDYGHFIVYLSIILSLDVVSAIPFAKLRAENKALRFARIKIINIVVNIVFNLFFILLCPYLNENLHDHTMARWIRLIYDPGVSLINYIFISNVLASAVAVILLFPEFKRIKLKFDFSVWKDLLIYGLPLLFAGLAGVMNDTLGRILIRYLLPEDIAEVQLGIYSASFKIAVLMSLFIQAFRYAAEPFFFSYALKSDAKQVYASVMTYFVISASLIFMAIMINLESVILIVGKDFREAQGVIPVLLFSNIFLGIYYNLSVWFKLTNRTRYGAYLAFIGAFITVLLNSILIPSIGYIGSAYSSLFCYGTMMVLSFFLMLRFYRIHYEIPKIILYLSMAFGFYILDTLIMPGSLTIKLLENLAFFGIFLLIAFLLERPTFLKLKA